MRLNIIFTLLLTVSSTLSFVTNSNIKNSEIVKMETEPYFNFTNVKPTSKILGNTVLKGTHSYPINTRIWIFLSNGSGYFIQPPAITLSSGLWKHGNINIGTGITSIVVFKVDETAHEELLKIDDYGQIPAQKLPKGMTNIKVMLIN